MQSNAAYRFKNFQNKYPLKNFSNFLDSPLADLNEEDEIWTLFKDNINKTFDKKFIHLLLYIRNLNRALFEEIEGNSAKCISKFWQAKEHNPQRNLDGGGVMNVIREHHLEKSAVNLSCVWGEKYPALEGENAGKPFAAAGVSLISHPRNPYAPIMHMNVRCIKIFDKNNDTFWIGGGADLTPMIQNEDEANLFHYNMKKVCENNNVDYEKFKKWADEYFYIPHRKESRGIGGIFFDYLKIEKEEDFSLLLDVGQYAALAYGEILARNIDKEYSEDLHIKHLYWRGRYAEFNLVYDRGTKFGLMSGGNYEAIFCSLPPQVRW